MKDLYGDVTEKKKKAGSESSKESSLRDWFGRKGAKGSKKGWVDCNAPDGSGGYKSCGRSDGEKRGKYPACRPTPGACKEKGRGKSWGKKAKSKKNEELMMDLEQIIREELEMLQAEAISKENEEELKKISDELKGASKMHKGQADRVDKILDSTDDEDLKESKKNCGCGQDPCKTYGIQENAKEENLEEKEGKKDACYHKVKSRYKVWPSAYASGALVKCRKVGAKNWGNSKKEQVRAMVEDEITQLLEIEEETLEEKKNSKCTKVTKKASSTRKGKKWMKCVKSDSGGYKRIHWGQAGVRVTGKSGNTKRKKSFKARHGCKGAKANTPKGQACKDWAE